jgi:hypothetical protein
MSRLMYIRSAVFELFHAYKARHVEGHFNRLSRGCEADSLLQIITACVTEGCVTRFMDRLSKLCATCLIFM